MTPKLDHIGIVVKNLNDSLIKYMSYLGLEVKKIEEIEVEGNKDRLAFLPIGETQIELIESSAQKGLVGDFLRAHGEGIHHIAIRVDDLEKTFNELHSQGVEFMWDRVIDRDPQTKIAFFKAKEFNGVYVELVERS
ncbi:MAG: VOC family protein [Planctomycetota bacterium]